MIFEILIFLIINSRRPLCLWIEHINQDAWRCPFPICLSAQFTVIFCELKLTRTCPCTVDSNTAKFLKTFEWAWKINEFLSSVLFKIPEENNRKIMQIPKFHICGKQLANERIVCSSFPSCALVSMPQSLTSLSFSATNFVLAWIFPLGRVFHVYFSKLLILLV